MTKQQETVAIIPPSCMMRGRVKGRGLHDLTLTLHLTCNTHRWMEMLATHGAGLHRYDEENRYSLKRW